VVRFLYGLFKSGMADSLERRVDKIRLKGGEAMMVGYLLTLIALLPILLCDMITAAKLAIIEIKSKHRSHNKE